MKKSIKYLVFAVVISTSSVYSQEQKLSKGDKEFNNYNYVNAIKVYENLYDKGYKSPELLKKIGDSYYFQANYETAARWYGELIGTGQSVNSEYYYRYAQSLKSLKDYVKADQMMDEFEKRNSNEIRANQAEIQKDYIDIIRRNSGRYELENSGINSSFSDYGAALNDNKMIFASSRNQPLNPNKNYNWNNEPFLDLYQADIDENGKLSNPKIYSKSLNSIYHESSAVFTKDGKTVYFTKNNSKNSKKVTNTNKVTLLKIYKATLEGDKWTNIKELPFNSNEYSVAHPSLSSDEKTLYFASDMPGTFGQSDIFKVEIKDEDDYGTPQNLGKDINTEGKESFPFISADNELYFSSDGHPGLGGLDVFVTSLNNGKSIKVQNVGEPVNSPNDDFAYFINSKTHNGFVSSNRHNGNGSDDIYKFKETKKISDVCQQKIEGIAMDDYLNKPLANAKVTLFDDKFKSLKETRTSVDGKYDFGFVECNSKFNIRVEKEGYEVIEKGINTNDKPGINNVDFETSSIFKEIKKGQDLGKVLELNPIYFDYRDASIRNDAEIELAKVLSILEEYPKLEIFIKSHTDSRASSEYNQMLSDKRAQSTLEWFVSKGIKRNRLKAKGYGESQLVNFCSDGVPCSEEQHQENRRSEFIVLKS